jgi:FkbM family methyltransferase
MRIFGRLADATGRMESVRITSNLGIAGCGLCDLPLNAPDIYLFGTEKQYIGENDTLHLLRRLSSLSDSFVDIGAFMGYFSFYIHSYSRGKLPIFFFEPTPKLFELIEGNVRKLGASEIFGFEVAISSDDGQVPFFLNELHPEQSSIEQALVGQKCLPRESRCFGSFAKEKNLVKTLVKVDVEGSEFAFVQGIGDESWRIQNLVIEVLDPAVRAGFLELAATRLSMNAYHIRGSELVQVLDPGSIFGSEFRNFLFTRMAAADLRSAVDGELTVCSYFGQ